MRCCMCCESVHALYFWNWHWLLLVVQLLLTQHLIDHVYASEPLKLLPKPLLMYSTFANCE
ncbi:hypothetical protein M758_8G135600 [Ceratodon purpureus]|nr:hypothetical protein M758_8G135600 [Ceratodon purpureus]